MYTHSTKLGSKDWNWKKGPENVTKSLKPPSPNTETKKKKRKERKINNLLWNTSFE